MASTPESRSTSQREPFAEPLQLLTNYQALVRRVVDVFGDEVKASRWLSLPNPDLTASHRFRSPSAMITAPSIWSRSLSASNMESTFDA